MAFSVDNKKSDFVFLIPVFLVIGFMFYIFYQQGALDDKLPEFLKYNKENKMITTESGLQYEVLVEGTGAKPVATDSVEVHYEGTLEDGTVFDSSYKRGEKISFPLNGVIRGWTEGLQLMSVGSKYKFTIPADLAYGDNSPSPLIPAGATLIFDVELFDIK